jgi:acyl carrier protein
MTEIRKIELLEDMLDLEAGTLKADLLIEDIEEWDSMAVISLIALLDGEFGKAITAKEIKSFKTIEDILKVME